MAFPTLFPNSDGDPTILSRNIGVSFRDGIKYLLKFSEFNNKTNCFEYRFASDLRFLFTAYNRIHRHQLLKTINVFFNNNCKEKNMNPEQIVELLSKKNF